MKSRSHRNPLKPASSIVVRDDTAAIAAFLLAKGVTRCPTACVSQTQSQVSEADRAALRRHAEALEARQLARLQARAAR